MKSKADSIRKRVAQRKRERDRKVNNINNQVLWADDEERHGFNKLPSYDKKEIKGDHPLFRIEWFFFKILASACLFLFVAIIFKNNATVFEPARNLVQTSMEKEFQFASVSNWYEEKFGKPLALLPIPDNKNGEKKEKSVNNEYALPASAKILEDFQVSGEKITIETAKGESVQAMSEGLVRFAGEKDKFGKTVIIQHADKSESWYGNLDKINVSPYEYIEKGTELGISAKSDDGLHGSFYFAIKKGDDFIDPMQVIPFE